MLVTHQAASNATTSLFDDNNSTILGITPLSAIT